jgi:hypothetical protein
VPAREPKRQPFTSPVTPGYDKDGMQFTPPVQ